MAETEFEKWIREKEARRKKPKGREFGKKSSTPRRKASISKLAKQPESDLKGDVKHQTVEEKPKSEENTTVSQDLNTRKKIGTKSGTALTSAQRAMKNSRSRKRRRESRKGGTSNS